MRLVLAALMVAAGTARAEPAEEARPRLGGIVVSAVERRAVFFLDDRVTGAVAAVGDRVGAWTVLAIARDAVEIGRGGERVTVRTEASGRAAPVPDPVTGNAMFGVAAAR